jgi:hypothetical protein
MKGRSEETMIDPLNDPLTTGLKDKGFHHVMALFGLLFFIRLFTNAIVEVPRVEPPHARYVFAPEPTATAAPALAAPDCLPPGDWAKQHGGNCIPFDQIIEQMRKDPEPEKIPVPSNPKLPETEI